jgi:hypothetical protein
MFWKRRKPSKIIIRHIEKKGSGFELDDYVNGKRSNEEERLVIGPLLEINSRFSTSEYLLGISNPDAYSELRNLAERLESEDL